jgi:AmmeMemoRadiSam system protein A
MYTEEERKKVLTVSHKTLEHYFSFGKKLKVTEEEINDPALFEKRGTFVTLTKDGTLRGCIGTILPLKPLILDVIDNTINAAFRDPRFPPLGKEELPLIKIEISVLTVPKKLEFSDKDDLLRKLRPGEDGVIIIKGPYQATFLPQVWDELPDKDSFLSHLCAKAGLSPYEYRNPKDLEVFTYEVEIINSD